MVPHLCLARSEASSSDRRHQASAMTSFATARDWWIVHVARRIDVTPRRTAPSGRETSDLRNARAAARSVDPSTNMRISIQTSFVGD